MLVEAGPARILATANSPSVRVADGRLHAELLRAQWDFTTIVGGVRIGALVAHVPGAIIGGVMCGVWGRWRWNQSGIS